MTLVIESLHPRFMAAVRGINLKTERAAAAFGELERALDRNAVVALPAQHLTDDEQIAASQLLGELSYALNPGRAQGVSTRLQPALYDISNLDENNAILGASDRRRLLREGDRLWHTDRSFVDAETSYSLLSGRVVPPEGGDTEFADMRAAWDDLPDAMKRRVEGLRAEHSYWHSRSLVAGPDFKPDNSGIFPPVTQPLVRTHPRTGRKSLVLASHASHIIGWPVDEGRALLAELTRFALQPQYICAHRWSAGDLVIWDNRCTMHRGTDFDDRKYTRDMRRTTVQGEPTYLRAA